jgi:hypothetical protein
LFEREREVTGYSSHSLSHKAVAVFKNFFSFSFKFHCFWLCGAFTIIQI